MNKQGKNAVVARMTITFRASKKKVIVEVHSDASFKRFYVWYSQIGRNRKSQIMTTHRGFGTGPHWRQAFEAPGLEQVSAQYTRDRKDVENVAIKVFRKREYNQLLNCAPDALGAGLPKAGNTQEMIGKFRDRRGIPVRIPAGYLGLQERMDIITGVKR